MIREQIGKNKGTKLNMFTNQSLTGLDKSHKNICLYSPVLPEKSGFYLRFISGFAGALSGFYCLLQSITYNLIREQNYEY